MRERPILFSGPMVRAILSGTKTQTRRVVKPQPVADANWVGGGYWERNAATITQPIPTRLCIPDMTEFGPCGQPGDRLWVRETFAEKLAHTGRPMGWAYRADGERAEYELGNGRWSPSIHMPRWASRITLEITGVRVERLQDISEDEARDEGAQSWAAETVIDGNKYPSCRAAFIELWRSTNSPGSWEANPWLWVIAFRRVAPLAGEEK